jgi:lipoprotein NlpD
MSRSRAAICPLMLVVLAGCAMHPNRAPVEDRMATPRPALPIAAAPVAANPVSDDPAKALPGAENTGKPGYYTVKPGDTLIRIGLDNGQNWKDLVKWNGLENPNIIEVGQTLRVMQPGADPGLAQTRAVVAARVESRPIAAASPPSGTTPTSAAAGPTTAPAQPSAGAAATSAAPAMPHEGDDDVRWAWPANGSVTAPFEEGKVKGLVIGGKAGDPVLAAADGRVVYAGSGLRGYGNLVILKHNATYLTAYAHNQSLLVKEDQNVKRGQKIAEMGSTDADSVQLHFEIRKQGKPIDPAKLLPPR